MPFQVETRVEIKVDAYLPQEYVKGESQRMEVYKRIALIKSREEREDALEEMIDRFGDPPKEVMNLIDIAHLRGVCGKMGVSRVNYLANTMIFKLAQNAMPDPEKMYAALTETDRRLLISAGREPAILLRDPALGAEEMLRAAVPLMEKVQRLLSDENTNE